MTTNFLFGDIEVRPGHNTVVKSGDAHTVPPRMMDVLLYLIENRDRVVSADELLDQLWKDRVVEESTIHRQISQIRTTLGDSAKEPIYIRTVTKRGYQVIAPVKLLAMPAVDGADPHTMTDAQDVTAAVVKKTNRGILGLASAVVVVVVIALLLFANTGSLRQNEKLHTLEELQSLAVLPFRNMSTDTRIDPYAEGLVDSILNELTVDEDLRIASRTETFHLTNEGLRAQALAAALKVAYYLEGSIQVDPDTMRVTAQLIRASDGFHVFSKQYDLASHVDLELQASVAGKIAHLARSKLHSDIVRTHPMLFAEFRDANPEALDYYLDSQDEYSRFVLGEAGDVRHALQLMEKAAVLDPGFDAAQFQLAWNYANRIDPGISPETAALQAHLALDRVQARNPGLADEMFFRTQVYLNLDLDYASAERTIRAGIALYPEGRWWNMFLAMIALREGHAGEAIKLIEMSRAQDFGEELSSFLYLYATTLLELGEYSLAIEATERAVQILDGGEPLGNALLLQSAALIELGRIAQALPIIEHAWKISGTTRPAAFAAVFAHSGQITRAMRVLETDVVPGRRDEFMFGYLALGQIDSAFRVLSAAIEDRDASVLLRLRSSSRLDPMRADPRFEKALARISELETRSTAGAESRESARQKVKLTH